MSFILLIIGATLPQAIKRATYRIVEDLMFIDSPTDGSSGDDNLSEKGQYDEWKEGAVDIAVAVFSVTNPEEVVSAGAAPVVQEVGPINAIWTQTAVLGDADLDAWASTGKARYRLQTRFELDNDTCLADCQARLDQLVVIPNPVWHQLVLSGQSTVVIAAAYIGGVAQGAVAAATAAAAPSAPSTAAIAGFFATAFGSSSSGIDATSSESQAFFVGVVSVSSSAGLTNMGYFLASASAAGTLAQAGDTSGTCMIGGLTLSVSRCVALAQALTMKVPGTFASLRTTYAAAYGAGTAAPFFIQRPLRQVVAFQSETFSDPITGVEVALPALHDDITDVGKEVVKQMASSFAEQGVNFFAEYDGGVKECRLDIDCWPAGGLSALATPSTCSDSATCEPLYYGHYSVSAIPGRNFGTSRGFSSFGVGTTYPTLMDGIPLELVIQGEKQKTVGDDVELEYLDVRLHHIPVQLGDCSGGSSNSPGIDCDSPRGAKNIGPVKSGVPFYATMAHFDTTGMEAVDSMSNGYDPLTRVTILPCTGDPFCDEDRPSRFVPYLHIEPETGYTVKANIAVQLALRVGHTTSSLHPSLADSLIPLYWYQLQGGASKNDETDLASLQGVPVFMDFLTILLVVLGVINMLCGCCGMCCLCFFNKKRKPKVVEAQAVVVIPMGS